jgi:hypothetical protein
MGSMPLGERDALLTRPGGGPFPLFTSEVSFGPGPGLEVHFGRAVGARVGLEGSGAWTFTRIRATLTSDVEGIADTTVSEDVARFSVEGSALVRVAGDVRRSISLRAGAGWMRELAGGSTLAGTGVIGSLGAAVKYWWGTSSSVQRRQVGMRLDGRAVLRSGGVDLGDSGVRLAPAGSAALMIRF